MPTDSAAKKVIKDCLQVKEDEQVLIQTWPHTLDLSDALALETYKAGATPIVTLSTDQSFLDYVTKVPEKYYTKQPKAMLSMLDDIDAQVLLFGPKDPKILKAAPGERMAKAFDSEKSVMAKVKDRKIRTAYLPVGYITAERAQNYGFDLTNWRRNFDQALDADMMKVSELGKKLAGKLENADKIEITHDKGTKLTFNIRNRPIFIRDGIIDQDDLSKGNYGEYLPSGSVTVAPVETSTEGEVVFDEAQAYMGKMVKGLRLVFQNGKLTSYHGQENLEAFAETYRGATGDKDRIGFFSIGLNPNAKHMGMAGDELVQGAVTIGIGYNMDVGGKNDTATGYAQTLTKATVTVDGKPLLTAGKLQI